MLASKVKVSAHPVEELYEELLADERTFILDVRNEEDFARWGVEGRRSLNVVNIPYFDFIEDEEEALSRLPEGANNVLVVCAKEGSSEYVAEILQSRGIRASYLQEGILSWGGLYDARDAVNTEFGRIVQVARPARGDLSFVVISDGDAAIIDPLRHTENYLKVIEEAGAKLTHIFDTHAHADHISGGPELANRTGAPYYLHAYDAIHPMDMLPAAIDYEHITDGQEFQVGQYTVKVIWFPGHTLGQVNYLFTDPNGRSYLFSGDGIFLNSFGRPDLGGQGEAWAPILYDSLYHRLPPHLNNDTLILPAHFSILDEDNGDGVFARSYSQILAENEAPSRNQRGFSRLRSESSADLPQRVYPDQAGQHRSGRTE
jgi:glyoxylase-like metal-dependent hydrolase (beta-lactamase superfamily II)/rhodanese-related sulfurtransferase